MLSRNLIRESQLIRLANRSLGTYVLDMTWAEICADEILATLPYRIESDRWGNIVMSPPPRSRHAEYQGRIAALLHEKMAGGLMLPEWPIQTKGGVKAADVAWVSQKRRPSRPNHPGYLF